MAGYFSDIMLYCSIYLVEVVYSSPCCSTSLSLVVPSFLAELVYIVSRKTPAPFF